MNPNPVSRRSVLRDAFVSASCWATSSLGARGAGRSAVVLEIRAIIHVVGAYSGQFAIARISVAHADSSLSDNPLRNSDL